MQKAQLFLQVRYNQKERSHSWTLKKVVTMFTSISIISTDSQWSELSLWACCLMPKDWISKRTVLAGSNM